MINIGITGASGFIGGYLLPVLAANPEYNIRPLYRSALQQPSYDNVEPMVGDLSSPADCARFVQNLDVILHLAHNGTPLSSGTDLAANLNSNLVPSLNLIQAIRQKAPGCKVIFASSGGAVYGLPYGEAHRIPFNETDPCNPLSFYGIQKFTIEHYLRVAADNGWLSSVILRISNPYGIPLSLDRRQGIIGIAMQQAFTGAALPIYGSIDNVRDYIHLDDVAKAVAAAIAYDTAYDIFNISTGSGHSLKSVLDLIGEISGKKVIIGPQDTDNQKNQLVPWVVTNPAKAINQLGWSPTIDLTSGIQKLHSLITPLHQRAHPVLQRREDDRERNKIHS